jgi:hypothetical protein
LFERNFNHYRIDYTIGYILGQLLIAGPVMGGLLIWWACRSVFSLLYKSVKYCLVGIYVFFLLGSFHGKIEPNWTIAAFIPLIVLSHEYLDQKVQLQKWVYKTVPFTLIVVVITRIAMATEIHFLGLDIKSEFYKNKTVANNILSKAGETPVVFINSYAGASKYWFYTGHASFSLNTAKYHRNSYNYWPMEDSLIGKPLM